MKEAQAKLQADLLEQQRKVVIYWYYFIVIFWQLNTIERSDATRSTAADIRSIQTSKHQSFIVQCFNDKVMRVRVALRQAPLDHVVGSALLVFRVADLVRWISTNNQQQQTTTRTTTNNKKQFVCFFLTHRCIMARRGRSISVRAL